MSKYVMPPRQKMINLIYIILIAILAIHISKDAIEGYDIISNDYRPQIAQLQTYNEELRVRLEQEKPEVTGQVQSVKEKTNAIRQELNDLKENIIRTADKDEYQSGILKNRDNEKATPDVLLSNKRGNNLKNSIATYKQEMESMLAGDAQKKLVSSYMNITPQTDNASWEEETFSHLTANAGITMLDKMEMELLSCEKEVLLAMTNGTGIQTSEVTPEAGKPQKEAEKEVEKEPAELSDNQIFVNGVPTDILADGTLKKPFVQMAPEAAVLYKGYDNKLQLTSIGIPQEQLKVSMKNGKVVMRNNCYIALPDNNSRTAVITVSDGADVLARYEYEVRNLPAPQPYLSYSHNGKNTLYKGDVPLGKSHLLGMNELVAQANEGPQVKYKVVSFETVFIEAGSNKVITLKNKGNKFSGEQKKAIEQLQAGDKFYITSITVSGGQKTDEQIGSINVVLY